MMKNLLMGLGFWLGISCSFGQNPLIKDIGMSDPHMRVYGDTLYLYCGHDSSPDDTTWVMKDWRVFSSMDLVNWSLEEVISPARNYMGDQSTDCWAGDAATRNGNYFFYFSDRKRGVGVMQSASPTGPFRDALGKALVSPMHDPTILVDKDPARTPYMIYGDKTGSFHIVRLNEDMISLAEEPQPISILGEEWENAPEWMDKNYIFKYDDTYYLSWGRDYAVATDIYGPYTCVGPVGVGHHLTEYAHGSFFWWKGQFYHLWCYYLREGFKYRESIISYCHLDDQGHIVTDTEFLDLHFANGVGQYQASWNEIQAEWYYEISPGITKRGNRNKGFVLSNIKDGDWIRFARVNFEEEFRQFQALLFMEEGAGFLEVRADGPDGPLLGTLPVEAASANMEIFSTETCKLESVSGDKDIYLCFHGNSGSTLTIDWIKFLPAQVKKEAKIEIVFN